MIKSEAGRRRQRARDSGEEEPNGNGKEAEVAIRFLENDKSWLKRLFPE
jgi:hypothetical protein